MDAARDAPYSSLMSIISSSVIFSRFLEPNSSISANLGFDLEQLSPNSYAVNGIPSQLGTASALQVLQHILAEVHTTGTTVAETWQRRIALSLARDTAIPYGKTLTREEMLDLLKRLFALPTYRMTEDGQRVVVQMGDDEIAKHFYKFTQKIYVLIAK